jgi:WD40 repeat protein
LRVLQGHSRQVTDVIALPGGQALSASFDNTFRLWDLATGETLRIFEGHSGWSPNIVTLPRGGYLTGWEAVTGKLYTGGSSYALEALSGWVTNIIALPDGRALSTSFDFSGLWGFATPGPGRSRKPDATLRLLDLATGETLRVLQGHSGAVTRIIGLPDGRALSASYDNTLRLWDLATGTTIARFVMDTPITALAISGASQRIMVGDQKGRVFTLRLGGVRLDCL